MTATVRRTTTWRRAAAVPVLALALAGLTACGTPVDLGPEPALTGTQTTLSVVDGFHGAVVADGTGRVLYQFAGDRDGQSTCYGPCAQTWQPYIATGEPGVDYPNLSAIVADDIDLVPREDGQPQVRYADRPLYFFAGDQAPQEVNGVGREEFGGQWTAVSVSGKPVLP